MADMIKSDYQLDKEAKSYAELIFADFQGDEGKDFDPESCRDELFDAAHEWADQSEHVIYTARAIAICGNCNTDKGEEWLDGIYEKPFDGCDTFADVCTRLAYAELLCRIEEALQEVIADFEASKEESEE